MSESGPATVERAAQKASAARRLWGWCREHPVTAVVFSVGTVAGAVAAVVLELGPEDMATWKRALGGALAGAWLAMFPLGFRLFD